MKTRLKSWITSILGIVIMLAASFMFFFGEMVVNKEDYEMAIGTWLISMFLGFVFLMAKNSLITGIFFGLLKIKNPEEKE